MKTFLLFFTALLTAPISWAHTHSSTNSNSVTTTAYRYNEPFIFTEAGITFSVYPDGEFDFYLDSHLQFGGGQITFNTGYDYGPYVQYDHYGAVVQIQNIPLHYDYYGRISRIGGIDIRYRNGVMIGLGGLQIRFDPYGAFIGTTGYINPYNRYYVYRPYHAYFVRPRPNFCMVYPTPYRRYYRPVRYKYYKPYRHNYRKSYARAGKPYRGSGKHNAHDRVYRNDQRVSVRQSNRQPVPRTRAQQPSKRYNAPKKSVRPRNSDSQYMRNNTKRPTQAVRTSSRENPVKETRIAKSTNGYRKSATSPDRTRSSRSSAAVKTSRSSYQKARTNSKRNSKVRSRSSASKSRRADVAQASSSRRRN